MSLESLLLGTGFECVPINPEHFLLDFECGHDSALGDWLRGHAQTYHSENLCRVWVLARSSTPESVAGYFTLSSHSVEVGAIARRQRYDDPRNGNEVNGVGRMPAQLLGKFALDQNQQGKGLGRLLMSCVYATYLASADHAGCKYLVVEARKPELVTYYQQMGFIASDAVRGGSTSLYRSTSAIRADITAILSVER